MSRKIDSFQRKLLRHVLNVYWPNQMCNEEVISRTKSVSWSSSIEKRRLRLFSQVLRLPLNTPVNHALEVSVRAVRMPPGRRKTSWFDNVREDLRTRGVAGDLQQRRVKAADKSYWRRMVHNVGDA